jgi:hypothetical protein
MHDNNSLYKAFAGNTTQNYVNPEFGTHQVSIVNFYSTMSWWEF